MLANFQVVRQLEELKESRRKLKKELKENLINCSLHLKRVRRKVVQYDEGGVFCNRPERSLQAIVLGEGIEITHIIE